MKTLRSTRVSMLMMVLEMPLDGPNDNNIIILPRSTTVGPGRVICPLQTLKGPVRGMTITLVPSPYRKGHTSGQRADKLGNCFVCPSKYNYGVPNSRLNYVSSFPFTIGARGRTGCQ